MTILHAYLRNATETFEVDAGDQILKFAPNDKGHVIAEVDDVTAAQIIERAPDAYRVYGTQAATSAPSSGSNPQLGTFVLTDTDGVEMDLGAMDDAELRKFAAEEKLPKPHHMIKGDKLRQLIMDGIRAKSDEPAA